MKKWLCALSICAVTGLGVFGFAGCGNGSEVDSISLKAIPTTEVYVGDVVSQTFGNGVVVVKYNNGRTAELPLSMADLVYVDYGDSSTGNQFTAEAKFQRVVVRYKSKTADYGVKVNKRDLNLTYAKTVAVTYTGEECSAENVLGLELPDGVAVSKIEYRVHSDNGENVAEFGSAPFDAGVYDLRVTIDGGEMYNDLVIEDISFEVRKAKIGFALEKSVAFDKIFVQTGDSVDLTKNWVVDNKNGQIFSSALKTQFSTLVNNITYQYKEVSEKDYKDIQKTDGAYDLSKIPTGEYNIRAFASGMKNFEDFEFASNMVVSARALEYGTDFTITVMVGENVVEYKTTTDLSDIQTVIETSDPTTVSVRVNYATAINDSITKSELFYRHSVPGATQWGGLASEITQYGDYQIWINAKTSNGSYLSKALLGIKIVKPTN